MKRTRSHWPQRRSWLPHQSMPAPGPQAICHLNRCLPKGEMIARALVRPTAPLIPLVDSPNPAWYGSRCATGLLTHAGSPQRTVSTSDTAWRNPDSSASASRAYRKCKRYLATVPLGVYSLRQPGARRAGPAGGRSPPCVQGSARPAYAGDRSAAAREAADARRRGVGQARQDGVESALQVRRRGSYSGMFWGHPGLPLRKQWRVSHVL